MGKLKEALRELAEDYQSAMMRKIATEKMVASGKLRKSIDYKVTEDGFTIESDSEYSYLLGEDGYEANKSRSKDNGKIDRLKDWARKRGFRPFTTVKSTGMRRFSKIKNKNKYWDRVAFMLRASMQKRGTIKRFGYKGSNIIKKVSQEMKSKGYDVIMEAYRLDLIQGMKQQFKFDNIKVE